MKPISKLTTASLALALYLTLLPGAAAAYVGPGAGLSAIGSVLAFLGVVLLAIIGFLWFPLKRMFARMRRDAAEATPDAPDAQ